MKPDKKQLPQLIALGALLLICIGYIGFKVAAPKAPPPPPPPAKEKPADKTAEVEETDASMAVKLPAVEKRDPFSPVMVASLPGAPASSYVPPRRLSQMQDMIPRRPVPRITTPLHIEPMPMPVPAMPQTTLASVPAPVPAPADPAFVVTGVIRGESNVAIIRVGDERHIVRQNQLINGTYKVVSVTDNGVVLAASDHRISLKLGGEKNAKQ